MLSIEHPHVVKCVAATRDDRWLATGCNDRKLRVYALTAGALSDGSPTLSQSLVATVEHPKAVRKVVLLPDDSTLVTGCEDGVVRAWSLAALTAAAPGAAAAVPVAEFSTGTAAAGVMDLEASPDGATVVVAAGKGIWLLHAKDLSLARKQEVPYDVSCATLHPTGGGLVVAAGSDVTVHVYRLPAGGADGDAGAAWAEVARLKGHHGIIHCARWSPDGRVFLSGADDAIIRVWGTEAVLAPAAK